LKNDLSPSLKKDLENSFGRKVVSSSNYLQIIDDILKTGYSVNANTLMLLLGLVKSNYSVLPSTLHTFKEIAISILRTNWKIFRQESIQR
jgi:hypothetical protein